MESLANLILEVKDELGADIAALYADDDEYARYLNQGQRRLGFHEEEVTTLTWNVDDASVALPADCVHLDKLVPAIGTTLPPHKVWNNVLYFLHPEGARSAGSATAYYYANYPTITDSQSSELPPEGDTAIVAFAAYRFFRRLASSRADYNRYSTVLAQNGIDLEELASIADDYLTEFESARESLPSEEPVSFYGD